jgi:hypothetical protein
MTTRFLSVQISAGVVLALLSCGASNGRAASATLPPTAGENFAQSSSLQNVAWEATRVEKLRHAYHLLEEANGDYSGHRVEAMRSIKKAGDFLGVDIKGSGHAEESQWTSDHRLQQSKQLLEELVDEGQGKEQPHIKRAIKEINKALSLK